MTVANRPVSTVAYAEDLVRRIRAQEADAFDELYSRYSPRVFGYLYQRLNGNTEEAEDLTSEVFAKVFEKIEGFQVQGAPLSYFLSAPTPGFPGMPISMTSFSLVRTRPVPSTR